jgi:hypothetical protein
MVMRMVAESYSKAAGAAIHRVRHSKALELDPRIDTHGRRFYTLYQGG